MTWVNIPLTGRGPRRQTFVYIASSRTYHVLRLSKGLRCAIGESLSLQFDGPRLRIKSGGPLTVYVSGGCHRVAGMSIGPLVRSGIPVNVRIPMTLDDDGWWYSGDPVAPPGEEINGGYQSHFATCPNADRHRGGK